MIQLRLNNFLKVTHFRACFTCNFSSRSCWFYIFVWQALHLDSEICISLCNLLTFLTFYEVFLVFTNSFFFLISFLFFIQFLKFTLHLQLLQNIGYIPRVVQYILVACLMPNSLYLPIPHPYIAPPPTHWQPLVCSLHLRDCFFIVIFTSLLYFLDSTYEWYHTLFVFLWLTLPSKSIHIAANGKIRSFLWLSNIPLFNSTSSLSIHLSMDTNNFF